MLWLLFAILVIAWIVQERTPTVRTVGVFNFAVSTFSRFVLPDD